MAETKTMITVEASVKAPLEKTWSCWTQPEHITQWCQASDDWHAPYAENDLRNGGRFITRMAARDGSFSFDFGGTYDLVDIHKTINYTMDDGRIAMITFAKEGDHTLVTEMFEAELENPKEMQKEGWQAILNNFKKYTENH